MPDYVDQLQRAIHLKQAPQRIISLVPSITELLFDLELNDEVVGITKFCVHPQKWFKTKTRIGGTKNIKIEIITSLKPDLIIANKEENVKEEIEDLNNIAPVFITDVNDLNDAIEMIDVLGEITNRKNQSQLIIQKIKKNFDELHLPNTKIFAAYLIWNNPIMVAAANTFINSMLNYCGFINVFKDEERYPQITIEALHALSPDVILLSSEPYPFKQKHIDLLQSNFINTKFYLVDGEMFSWYGSRLIKAPVYFQQLLNEIGANSNSFEKL